MAYENDAGTYLELSLRESGREDCPPDKTFHYTPKDYHLFHYVTRGQGTFVIRGKMYRLKRGDIFYIPPKEVPNYFPDRHDPWSYEWLGVGGSRADAIVEHTGLSAEHPILRDDEFKIKPFFDQIVSEHASKGRLNLLCLGQAYSMFGVMLRDKKTDLEEIDEGMAHLRIAKEYVGNNYAFEISVKDIAANVGVTPNYLSSLFKKYEGKTTKQYLTSVRMKRAATIILSGAYKIKDAGKMTGYKNQLHFSSEFRKYYGICPTEFAERGGLGEETEGE